MENEVRKPEESPIAQMVEQILQNPEFAGIVSELRGSGGEAQTPVVSQAEILSRLPDVMAMLKPLVGETAGAVSVNTAPAPEDIPVPETASSAEIPQKTEEPVKAASAGLPKKYDKNRAEKLMAALKPYLNRNRCEIIDKCVSVIQITDIVEALQGIEGLTKPKP